MPTLEATTAAEGTRAPWEAPPFDDIALSVEARLLADSVRRDLAVAAAPRARTAEIDTRLTAVLTEAAQANWDNYGAHPVLIESVERARQLLGLLPQYPLPEFGVEPHGRVALNWWIDHDHSLSILVGSGLDPSLVFAGAFGVGVTARGREPFTGEVVPEEIRVAMRRLYRASAGL
jgi:hypothetical protein